MSNLLVDKATQYADDVIAGKEITTTEVKIQCEWFIRDLKRQYEDDFPYYFDEKKLKMVSKILKLLNFATGFNAGQSVLDGLATFQCFFLANVFGWRFKDNKDKFRYRFIDLFIPRKNAKTFVCALCIIILMLTEDEYSEFYSISLNRDLASETKKALTQLLSTNEYFCEYFKIPKTLSGKCECLLTHSFYQPRTADANSNNAIRPSVIIADEIGAFKSNANIQAMQSGQRSVKNPLLFKLTTAYAEDKSIMLDELDYLKKIYDATEVNDRIFALLYYADKEHLWDDEGLYMSNPLRIEDNYDEIRNARERALAIPIERDEYLTKSMNYFMPSNSAVSFIELDMLRKCAKDESDFNWTGRKVFVGLDLSLTDDNTAVSMICKDDDGIIHSKSWCFIPANKQADKSRKEKVNYQRYIDNDICFACGNEIISYGFVEQFIMDLSKKYGVKIVQVGYDRANCISTADKLDREGIETVEVGQNAGILHQPTKWMLELIKEQKFAYDHENKLFEQNCQNARLRHDGGMRIYIHKKLSGKIDMLASTINALYLLQQYDYYSTGDLLLVL